MKIIINRIFGILRSKRNKKEHIAPDKLSPDAMADVMQEVDFLRSKYSVDVRNLEPNEIPSLPKRVK